MIYSEIKKNSSFNTLDLRKIVALDSNKIKEFLRKGSHCTPYLVRTSKKVTDENSHKGRI